VLASLSILDCNVLSALVLKVASLDTADILAVSSALILLCRTPSAAIALFSSANTSAILSATSESIFDCMTVSALFLTKASVSMLLWRFESLESRVAASASILL